MSSQPLNKAIELSKAGRKKHARILLSTILEDEPANEYAWLWYADTLPTVEARIEAIERGLNSNPGSQRLQQAVSLLRGAAGVPADADPKARINVPAPVFSQVRGTIAPRKKTENLRALAQALARRLAFGALVLVVIIYLSYFGLDMARGASFQDAILHAADKLVIYLGLLARGDLGLTTAGSLTLNPLPIMEVVPTVVARSLGLLAAALLIAAPTGVILGIWASRRRHSTWPLLTLLASIVGVSVPSFFAALLLQLGVIRLTREMGRVLLPVGGFGWDAHLLLPALVLAARPLAQITRVTFVTLNDILQQDYVRTAYSKGLVPRMVMNRHVIRNAIAPILTTIGVSLRFALSSLPVVEFFFGWPGMGFNLLKSISRQDDNLTVALILCLGVLFILVNLLLELSYRIVDPRFRSTPEHIGRGERKSVWESLTTMFDLRKLFSNNPIKSWLEKRRRAPAASPFRAVLEERGDTFDELYDRGAGERRVWLLGTLGNLPLMLGGLLVLGVLAVILFGPRLAPHSPYTTQGLTFKDGEFTVPPFEPGQSYPWGTDVLGRDLLSLILAGAQQTLLLVTLVVLARMAIGFTLGALAGWLKGSKIDQFLVGAAEVIAAFPSLLLSMTLILAFGIREGMRPFIIALCFVGWGEIMQFVRGEVIGIRPKLFIESAVALGSRTLRIILWHVLPNLVPALITIAALEMGAVLMLLGELGFIGIFIGGGAFAELDVAAAPYHYSDVPEWGALLSNVRTYARAYPWTAIYPSLAFFVAILGFNLFGEGLRRMVEIVGVRVMRLFNRYTLAFGLIAAMGFVWVRGNTGATVFYQRQASVFSGQRAMIDVEALSDPAMQGRALGSPGLEVAANYIAQRFQDLGIQAAGKEFTYFQPRSRDYESLDATPKLTIDDGGPPLVYHRDFAERPFAYRNLGQVRSQVKVLAFGELTGSGRYFRTPRPALRDSDYSQDILLFIDESDVSLLLPLQPAGILAVAKDPLDLQRRYTLSPRDPRWSNYGSSRVQGQDSPIFWISEELADRILEDIGKTVDELRRLREDLGQDEVLELPTGMTVSMEMQGTVQEKVPASHVIGHLPGVSSNQFEGLDDRMIVVLAQYDSPPAGPDGLYPAANDNAAGVGVMLEAIRTMQESGYQPYKTFLFVAYSGEGLEGGGQVNPRDVSKFLQAKLGFSSTFEVEAIVELRGLGTRHGDQLVLLTGGSLRLANLFEDAARRMGVPTHRAGERVDISVIYEQGSTFDSGEEAPRIGLVWEGWEATSRSAGDTLDSISVENLERSGQALSLALMILGRETQY